MSNIIFNIVIALVGIGISPFMNAVIKRFCNDEKIFDKQLKQDMIFDTKLALITPISFIVLFYKFGLTENFFLFSFLMILLIIDAFCDIKAQIIPNGSNMIGLIVGLSYMFIKLVFDVNKGLDLLLGMFVGAGIFLVIALFALIAYRKEGMGLGDVKLMGVLGLFFGIRNIFQIFIVSFAFGAIVSILLLITRIKKSDDYIPFGPFIVLATILTMFVPYSNVLTLLVNRI